MTVRLTRPQRKAAFTLLEMMVVVGILSLLIAILMPSLSRGREQSRSVKCRSNLHQWGLAMAMYAGSNKDVLPFEERPDPRPGMGEDENQDKAWDPVPAAPGRPAEPRGWVCWFDCLDRSMGSGAMDEDVKICPTVRRFEPNHEESYRMNSKLADSSQYKKDGSLNRYYMPYRKLHTLKRPAVTVVLFDGDVGFGTARPGVTSTAPPSFKGRWRLSDDDVNYRHNIAANLLFADWHAENINKKSLALNSYDKAAFEAGRPNPVGAIIWQPPDMGPWDPDPGSGD
jgi:prepilin-type N-terminal cleavage/methylation domain-containing protein/prepilin-type processing-associated H-X9-DG protein